MSLSVNEYQVALLEADDGRNGKDLLSDKRMQICFKKLGRFSVILLDYFYSKNGLT